jgi:retinol dehydrogenase 12
MADFSFFEMIRSHIFDTLPQPNNDFTGKTIIVTGANSGLGLEAARHLVRLNATKVILAVRNKTKGQAAADDIHTSTGKSNVAEVWELDLVSYASVQAFAERANKELKQLHVVVQNAGILQRTFAKAEDNEAHITVNVISTLMLGILLLPKLRETAQSTGQDTVLTFVGSWMHNVTSFPEQKSEHIFEDLAQEKSARMGDR